MDESIRIYVGLRWQRAIEELETAQANIEHGRYRVAISRAYYAVFCMASAALFTQSIQRSKHSGIEAAFSQYLVKSGAIEPEFSRSYQQIRRLREEVDYNAHPVIDETKATETLAKAQAFVERVERYLRQGGAL